MEAEQRGSISNLDSMQTNKDQFVHAIRKFMEMQTLSAPLLRELIDHIDVYKTEGTGKNRTPAHYDPLQIRGCD